MIIGKYSGRLINNKPGDPDKVSRYGFTVCTAIMRQASYLLTENISDPDAPKTVRMQQVHVHISVIFTVLCLFMPMFSSLFRITYLAGW